MPHYYVIQPDGNFAIYSSVVDDYLISGLTREELINHILYDEHEETVRELNHVCDYLEGKVTVTPERNTMLYKDAETMRKLIHGKDLDELEKIR